MSFKRSNEAFWWSLFSAGGVMSALFMPVFVAASMLQPRLQGDRGVEAWERLAETVSWWPVRIALFGIIALSFFHAGHRIRHVLIDLGWRHMTGPLSFVCYAGAFAGAGITAWLLLDLRAP